VAREERESTQIGLFGGTASPAKKIALPNVEDWAPLDRLNEQAAALGLHLQHPLDAYDAELQRLRVKSYAEVSQMRTEGAVRLAGLVGSKRERTSQRGSKFAFVQMSDTSGGYEITVFSEVLAAARDLLVPGKLVLIRGAVQMQGETMRLTAIGIDSLDKASSGTTALLKVYLDDQKALPSLKQVLAREKPGKGDVILVTRVDDDTEIDVKLPLKLAVSPSLAQALKAIPGVADVRRI
jgi:DNA polymerase-3 subunit alpha